LRSWPVLPSEQADPKGCVVMVYETDEERAARARSGWILFGVGVAVIVAVGVAVLVLHSQHPSTLVQHTHTHIRHSLKHPSDWKPATWVALVVALAGLVGAIAGLVRAVKK
jgi:hypothetical protein